MKRKRGNDTVKKTVRLRAIIVSLALVIALLTSNVGYVYASDEILDREDESTSGPSQDGMLDDTSVSLDVRLDLDAKAAILVEASTGKVLYEQNCDESMSPASVTKIMTLLLTMEAMESGAFTLDTLVTASEHASSIGGSQIYLEAGEQLSVKDMIKSVVVASANDVATALAELVSGSEELFVQKMNERAKELGMKNTNFENPTGLDDNTVNHVTSARDIAIMSRELMKHELIFEFTGIWQDSIRNGEFVLTNTNRMIRYYSGCTGLKTGSTSKAGYCISSTAERDGMELIAVILGASTRESRNASAAKLLDHGFSNYAYVSIEGKTLDPINVSFGVKNSVGLGYKSFSAVCAKSDAQKINAEIVVPDKLSAPIVKGDLVGEIIYKSGDKELGREKIYALDNVEKVTFSHVLGKILKKYLFI